MESAFSNNEDQKRYELATENGTARVEYLLAQDKIYLTHTEVPKALNGKGVGSAIVKQALEDVERKGLKLIPLCPFVAMYLKRNPEWYKLLGDNITIG